MKNEIKNQFSMLVLLKKLGILPNDFPLNKRFPCFLHRSSNPTTAKISDDDRTVQCFSECQKTFNVIDIYMQIRKTTFFETLKRMQAFIKTKEYQNLLQQQPNFYQPNHYKIVVKTKRLLNKTKSKNDMVSLFERITNYYHILLLKHKDCKGIEYLTETRKLKLSTIQKFKLGYAVNSNNVLSFQLVQCFKKNNFDLKELTQYGIIKEKINKKQKKYFHDTFHKSIIIPILNENSETYYFYENHFQESKFIQPKYKALSNKLNIELFEYLYGFYENFTSIKQLKTMIIHEGFFDLFQTYNFGIKNVVAMGNVNLLLSYKQLSVLKENDIKVILALDNDETGEKISQQLVNQLKEHGIANEIRTILYPYNMTCKDADELLKQFGILGYQQCYQTNYKTYVETKIRNKNKVIVKLASKIFDSNKIEFIN
ncbi:MAG: toprim domain-containing protein [Phytoplasma sp.]|uniref:toprim domain-containing protein n=1 Tax=Phytoplasma sp. TaxID=2155 RepID=UPI002B40DB53|nr:toprim domain-containing protein [Phytoplasma sp.]WRH06713.1 MAG: toprim domain-containing protein [Phytoplasma sp.]